VCRRAALGGDGGEGRGGGTPRPPHSVAASPERVGFRAGDTLDVSPGGQTHVLRLSHSPVQDAFRDMGVGDVIGGGVMRPNPTASSVAAAVFRVFSLLWDDEMKRAFGEEGYLAQLANEREREVERVQTSGGGKSNAAGKNNAVGGRERSQLFSSSSSSQKKTAAESDLLRHERGMAELAAVGVRLALFTLFCSQSTN
jgi:hypothetical protein